ncbi:MAG: hypothetical protein ACHREM_17250 [Polyangiales bacterium]
MHRSAVRFAPALLVLLAASAACTEQQAPTPQPAATSATASPIVIDPAARARFEAVNDRFGVARSIAAQQAEAVDDRAVVREAHRAGSIANPIAIPILPIVVSTQKAGAR